MTIIKRSRQPVGTTQSGTAHVRHGGIPKRQAPGRLLRRAEGEIRESDSRHTVVDSDEPSTDGRREGLHLRMAPQQGAERILQEKGEPRRLAAQPVERQLPGSESFPGRSIRNPQTGKVPLTSLCVVSASIFLKADAPRANMAIVVDTIESTNNLGLIAAGSEAALQRASRLEYITDM
jgi:hypothetical protein